MMDPLEHIRMLKDSAAGIAPRKGDLKRIRALRFTQPGFDREMWRKMCDMGWLGLRVSEDAGGSGLGVRELCSLAEELGAGLVPEPLIPAAMAAVLLPAEHLSDVLSGERIVLPAWQEQQNSLALTGATELREGRLNGRKLFVPMAAGADAFLVTVPGGLALVERDAPGVHVELHETQDGGNYGTLIFDNAPAEPIEGDATDALEQTIMATAAYLLGLIDRAFAITLDYIKTREQFGRKIGSFQALQHRAADMQIQLSLTRAVVRSAAVTVDRVGQREEQQAAVSRAKIRASDAAMTVTRACIQLHGGVGYTDAYDIGLFLRKAMVLMPLYGGPSVHRARFRRVAPETADE
ncbi:MAG TPA: acyl-CoA dehydrogenase family protein [Acetobacteraceae bacterium]|jgi:alkylation response protein AidB-like acyl-CoA dehydrogenase|nr:acyl-CoA dehydrogenase family protein [Acetobacteraceae bacterium]